MKIRVTVSRDGSNIKVAAIDLAGDAWFDYSKHLKDAFKAEELGRSHDKNRAVRAAMISLAAHFEGVMEKVCTLLAKAESGLPKLSIPKGGRSFRGKITALEDYARLCISVPLPPLEKRFKLFRDIVAHPGITKVDKEADPNNPVILSEFDVLNISAADVHRQGISVQKWLDSLCAICSVERVENTEKIVNTLGEALGEISEPAQRL